MSKLQSVKTVTFPNGYTINLPYEVTINCEGSENHIMLELLLKQIIKLKEEMNE